MKDLTKGRPSTLILAFALPIFLANLLQLTYKNRWLCSWRGYTCGSGSYHDTQQSDDWISDGIVQWICNYYRAEIWSKR